MTEELVQGTPEWHAARCGSLGASALHEALAKTKTGWAATRANRMATIVIERLTGQTQETYQNAAMRDGIEREPDARAAYQFEMNTRVVQIGLVRHPKIEGTHASPDGLVGDDGLVEIKCPQPAQHLATLKGEPIASKYLLQMQWQMRCCDRAWCDFVSYNPDFPESMKLVIKRVRRDEHMIADIERDVIEFLAEIDANVAELRRLYEREAA